MHQRGIVDIAGKLAAHAQEAGLERGIGAPVPGRIGLVALHQRRDALAVHRVGALVAIVLRDVHPEFEILQALEEGDAAAAADPGAAEIGGAGLVGAVFLDAA